MTEIFNRKAYTTRRRDLRKNMPSAELILWSRLRAKQLKGYKFRRQYSFDQYIVDFYAPQERLAVEIDGESHIGLRAEQYDTERQRYIENLGVTCLHFTNWDVYENLSGVLEKITEHLQ